MTETLEENANREIVCTRVIDAPRERVFEAWIDPQQLQHWWGPKGFTNTFQEFDPRPGGAWRFVMHGPDGVDYRNESVFVEIVKPERIVIDHLSGPRFRGVASFTAEGGKTRLTWRMTFQSTAERDRIKVIAVPGNEQNFDRLEAHLAHADPATADASDREIVLTRLFDAPRERVFQAWTDPQQLEVWWGPNGFTSTTHEIAVKAGGVWRFVMHGPDGVDYPNRIDYREVTAPERIVYDHGGGKQGKPPDFHVTVTFTAVGKKTEVTLRSVFPSAAARDRVIKEFGAIEGGKQMLERLADLLTKAAPVKEEK